MLRYDRKSSVAIGKCASTVAQSSQELHQKELGSKIQLVLAVTMPRITQGVSLVASILHCLNHLPGLPTMQATPERKSSCCRAV